MTKINQSNERIERLQVSRALTTIEEKLPILSGFINRTDSTLAFVSATRTFSISGTFQYWQNSIKYTVSGTDSVVIDDTEGNHYIYYDGDTLTATSTFSTDLILVYALVAIIHWDATNNVAVIFSDERHGFEMDGQDHLYFHSTFGARFSSGFGLGNMTVDGTGNAAGDAQFSVADGVMWDEDIKHTITNGAPQTLSTAAQIPMYYRLGANGDWRKITATAYPIATTGTGRAAWNEFTGGEWKLTEISSIKFVLTHYYATSDTVNPIIGLVGRAEYATAAAARAAARVELKNIDFGALNDLLPETVPIATVIWQTGSTYSNAVKSKVVHTDEGYDYIDWRPSVVPTGGTSL